jgi:predicted O-methyltransferase YrrM
MTEYRATTELPLVVERAYELAEASGFAKSCIPEVGRLLRLLTAVAPAGVVGEIGTGVGVSAAWMLSALRDDQRFMSVDLDRNLSEQASRLLGTAPNARFLHGEWRSLLPHGPFSLLFVDAGDAKDGGADEAVRSLKIGGVAVLDDFTPESQRPQEWRGKPDERREFWLNDRRLQSTEIQTTSKTAAILALRVA